MKGRRVSVLIVGDSVIGVDFVEGIQVYIACHRIRMLTGELSVLE